MPRANNCDDLNVFYSGKPAEDCPFCPSLWTTQCRGTSTYCTVNETHDGIGKPLTFATTLTWMNVRLSVCAYPILRY